MPVFNVTKIEYDEWPADCPFRPTQAEVEAAQAGRFSTVISVDAVDCYRIDAAQYGIMAHSPYCPYCADCAGGNKLFG